MEGKVTWEALFEGENEVFDVRQIGYDFSMPKLRLRRNLRDAYRFPGFVPAMIIRGVFGNPQARVVSLQCRQKNETRSVESSKRSEAYRVSRKPLWAVDLNSLIPACGLSYSRRVRGLTQAVWTEVLRARVARPGFKGEHRVCFVVRKLFVINWKGGRVVDCT